MIEILILVLVISAVVRVSIRDQKNAHLESEPAHSRNRHADGGGSPKINSQKSKIPLEIKLYIFLVFCAFFVDIVWGGGLKDFGKWIIGIPISIILIVYMVRHRKRSGGASGASGGGGDLGDGGGADGGGAGGGDGGGGGP